MPVVASLVEYTDKYHLIVAGNMTPPPEETQHSETETGRLPNRVIQETVSLDLSSLHGDAGAAHDEAEAALHTAARSTTRTGNLTPAAAAGRQSTLRTPDGSINDDTRESPESLELKLTLLAAQNNKVALDWFNEENAKRAASRSPQAETPPPAPASPPGYGRRSERDGIKKGEAPSDQVFRQIEDVHIKRQTGEIRYYRTDVELVCGFPLIVRHLGSAANYEDPDDDDNYIPGEKIAQPMVNQRKKVKSATQHRHYDFFFIRAYTRVRMVHFIQWIALQELDLGRVFFNLDSLWEGYVRWVVSTYRLPTTIIPGFYNDLASITQYNYHQYQRVDSLVALRADWSLRQYISSTPTGKVKGVEFDGTVHGN